MKLLILAGIISCPKPQIINLTNFPWNNFDQRNLETAKKRCGELYKNSTCVKKFTKKTESDYSVICGRGN